MADLQAGSGASQSIRRLAWLVLAVAVAVVISGDIVQATASGAGCGESWPRCDGALIPTLADAATAIEFTHRAATFTLSVLVAGLYFAARRGYRRGHRVRVAVRWVVTFFLFEVGIGALLVAFGWVEDDASVGRVVADGVHVINTFFLIGALALVAFYAGGTARVRFGIATPRQRLLAAGAGTLLLIAVTGAINSLADTLFPADTVMDGLRAEFGAAAPFLVRVRAVHPAVAILGGTAVLFIARRIAELSPSPAARLVQVAVAVQFAIGVANLALLTPLETQVMHLLTADILWILYLAMWWTAAAAGGGGEPAETRPAATVPA